MSMIRRLVAIELACALAIGMLTCAKNTTMCQQRLGSSNAFEKEVHARGARAVISDWINRIDPDQVARDWDCLLEAIGTAERGWMEVGWLLLPAADGAAGEDLEWAFAVAVDTNPKAALLYFESHGQGLATVCAFETLPVTRTTAQARQHFARRRDRVRHVTSPELKAVVEVCLRSIAEGESYIQDDADPR